MLGMRSTPRNIVEWLELCIMWCFWMMGLNELYKFCVVTAFTSKSAEFLFFFFNHKYVKDILFTTVYRSSFIARFGHIKLTQLTFVIALCWDLNTSACQSISIISKRTTANTHSFQFLKWPSEHSCILYFKTKFDHWNTFVYCIYG